MKFFKLNSITTKVWGLLAVAVLSLVIMLTIVFIELNSIINTVSETRRLREITDELILLGENLVDVETGQRGYQITEDEIFLQPYRASKDLIGQRLNKLDLLVKDSIVKQHLNQMIPVVQAKLEFACLTLLDELYTHFSKF